MNKGNGIDGAKERKEREIFFNRKWRDRKRNRQKREDKGRDQREREKANDKKGGMIWKIWNKTELMVGTPVIGKGRMETQS